MEKVTELELGGAMVHTKKSGQSSSPLPGHVTSRVTAVASHVT